MSSSNIIRFITFFTKGRETIDCTYGRLLATMGWNWENDGPILDYIRSGLRLQYSSDDLFYNYIEKLANNSEIDTYPVILKIIDILNLNETELDKKIADIYLGNPGFNTCGDAHQH
jgi:hypothetical protein